MKQVWKCDFCIETRIDEQQMNKHELGCVFNSVNKHCYTCKNHNSVFTESCEVLPFDDFFNVLDGDVKCNYWVLK